MTIHNGVIDDVFESVDLTLGGYSLLLEEEFILPQSDAVNKRTLVTVPQGLGVTSVLTFVAGVIIRQTVGLSDSFIGATSYHLGFSEAASVADRLRVAIPKTMTQALNIQSTLVVQAAVTLAERLGIAQVFAPAAKYRRSASDQFRITDVALRFLGAAVADTINISAIPDGVGFKGGIIDETLLITEGVVPRFLIRAIASDIIEISDDDLVNMIFSGKLVDGFEIIAAFTLPGVAFTTWVMNTRTAAVTEYQNYAFNSFARMGNKYLGASETGLYELMGDDDAGTDIVATIRSGFAQWAGAHLHSFKAAYLAVRGSGEFVLRVITADGKTYNYTVTAQNMKTVKVNMGKGLRARYFAFELISAGQDFDLETLEFIPLVAQRRV